MDYFRIAGDTATGPCIIIGQQRTTSGTTAIDGKHVSLSLRLALWAIFQHDRN